MLESLVDCEGEEADHEPETDAREVIVPGERTGDLLYYGNSHLVRNGISFYDTDGIS